MKTNIQVELFRAAFIQESIEESFLTPLCGVPYVTYSNFGEKYNEVDLKNLSFIPVLLHFKLPECVSNNNVPEIKDFHFFPTGTIFYRMPIPTDVSKVHHKALLELEQMGYDVYYVVPCFNKDIEFDEAYLSRTLIRKSFFIRPSDIGLDSIEKKSHVAFSIDGKAFSLFPPKPINMRIDFRRLLFDLTSRSLEMEDKSWSPEKAEAFINALEKVQASILEKSDNKFIQSMIRKSYFDNYKSQNIPIKFAHYFAMTFMDCELLFYDFEEIMST